MFIAVHCRARRTDGKLYPPKMLYYLLTSLLRHMCDVDQRALNFLDQNEPAFRKLHGTMGSLFRKLRQAGVGVDIKYACVLLQRKRICFGSVELLGTHISFITTSCYALLQ